jgi:hypothetical protein
MIVQVGQINDLPGPDDPGMEGILYFQARLCPSIGAMQEARVNGRLVMAGPDAPEVGLCPCCGCVVEKRKRRRGNDEVTYFWRHKAGADDGCPLRYHPDRG